LQNRTAGRVRPSSAAKAAATTKPALEGEQ
jgi:hypothetical protein